MPSTVHEKIARCENGEYPFAIARLPSGWWCLAETQPLRGYSILFSNPVVGAVHDLDLEGRAQWGVDCACIGDCLIAVCGAARVNYETWANLDPALHTHITPRFASEPADKRTLPPRQAYDWDLAPRVDGLSADVRALIQALRVALAGP